MVAVLGNCLLALLPPARICRLGGCHRTISIRVNVPQFEEKSALAVSRLQDQNRRWPQVVCVLRRPRETCPSHGGEGTFRASLPIETRAAGPRFEPLVEVPWYFIEPL